MIAIVDYGAGNLRSIRRALEAAGAETVITDDPAVLAAADSVVFPGVGAAGHAMAKLDAMGLTPVIRDAANAGKPFLGICLGMQLLFGEQEEGDTHGLGILKGRVRSVRADVKIPHIGWNRSRVVSPGPMGASDDEQYYYFVHSYIVEPENLDDVAAIAEYGERFPSVVVHDNIWGTQFHPEKSGEDGLRIVKRFVEFGHARAASKTGGDA